MQMRKTIKMAEELQENEYELLFFTVVPQKGNLHITTEYGCMQVDPNEICIIKNFNTGANGPANHRDFLTTVAWYEDREVPKYTIVNKYQGHVFSAQQVQIGSRVSDTNYTIQVTSAQFLTPVAWYKERDVPNQEHLFSTVQETMSEYLGYILGHYEAKEEGFCPGGATLHSIMTPHDPDANCFESVAEDTQSFMSESSFNMAVTKWPNKNKVDSDYYQCWQSLTKHFNSNAKKEGLKDKQQKTSTF